MGLKWDFNQHSEIQHRGFPSRWRWTHTFIRKGNPYLMVMLCSFPFFFWALPGQNSSAAQNPTFQMDWFLIQRKMSSFNTRKPQFSTPKDEAFLQIFPLPWNFHEDSPNSAHGVGAFSVHFRCRARGEWVGQTLIWSQDEIQLYTLWLWLT